MFYAAQLVSRDGPLQVLWVAATLDRQLNRQLVDGTAIPRMVEIYLAPDAPSGIFSAGSEPQQRAVGGAGGGRRHKGGQGRAAGEGSSFGDGAPLALRLSGQLLLGVCRIYSRKVTYLLQDCEKALLVLKNIRITEAPLAYGSLDQQDDSETRGTQPSLRMSDDSDNRRAAPTRGHRRGADAPCTGAPPPGGLRGELLLQYDDEDEILLEATGSQALPQTSSLDLLLGPTGAGTGTQGGSGRRGPGGANMERGASGYGLGEDGAGGGGPDIVTPPYGGTTPRMTRPLPWSGPWSSALAGLGGTGGAGDLFSNPHYPADGGHTYFEETPEHFEFDLTEHELEALRAVSHHDLVMDAPRSHAKTVVATSTADDPGAPEGLVDTFTTPQPHPQPPQLPSESISLCPMQTTEEAAGEGDSEGEPKQGGQDEDKKAEGDMEGEALEGRGGTGGSGSSMEAATVPEVPGNGDLGSGTPLRTTNLRNGEADMREVVEFVGDGDGGVAADYGGRSTEGDGVMGSADPGGCPEALPAAEEMASAAAAKNQALAPPGVEECGKDGSGDGNDDDEDKVPPTQLRREAPTPVMAAVVAASLAEQSSTALHVDDSSGGGDPGGDATNPKRSPLPSSSSPLPPPVMTPKPRRAAALRAQAALAAPANNDNEDNDNDDRGRVAKKKRTSVTPDAAAVKAARKDEAKESGGTPLPAGRNNPGSTPTQLDHARFGGKGLTFDVDREGRARTMLSTHAVRELLQNRSPLINTNHRNGTDLRRFPARAPLCTSPWMVARDQVHDHIHSVHLSLRPYHHQQQQHSHHKDHQHQSQRLGGGGGGAVAAVSAGGWTLREQLLDVAAGPATLPAHALSPSLQHLFRYIAGHPGGASYNEQLVEPPQEPAKREGKGMGKGKGKRGRDTTSPIPLVTGTKRPREGDGGNSTNVAEDSPTGQEGAAAAAAAAEVGPVEQAEEEEGAAGVGGCGTTTLKTVTVSHGSVPPGPDGRTLSHVSGMAEMAGGDVNGGAILSAAAFDTGLYGDGAGGGTASVAGTGSSGARGGGGGPDDVGVLRDASRALDHEMHQVLDLGGCDVAELLNTFPTICAERGGQPQKQQQQQEGQHQQASGADRAWDGKTAGKDEQQQEEEAEDEDEEEDELNSLVVEDAGAVSEMMPYADDDKEGVMEGEEEEEEEETEQLNPEGGRAAGRRRRAPSDGFTVRTRAVLRALQVMAAAASRERVRQDGGRSSSKRRRLQGKGNPSAWEELDRMNSLKVATVAELLVSVATTATENLTSATAITAQTSCEGVEIDGVEGMRHKEPTLCSRMAAARTFYDLLVLSNRGYISLQTTTTNNNNNTTAATPTQTAITARTATTPTTSQNNIPATAEATTAVTTNTESQRWEGRGDRSSGKAVECVGPEQLVVVARPRLLTAVTMRKKDSSQARRLGKGMAAHQAASPELRSDRGLSAG